jgi:hypothetical protein
MLTVEGAAAKAAEFIETIPPYPGTFEGRGVVICAGGVKYLTCAWVLIKMLRHLGCTLPIQVWYLGEDEGDPDWIELVRPLGVECVDTFEVAKRYPHPRLRGWESKPYAILHSRFKEVLFLDADNVPVVDPSFVFECEEFQEAGAVFWPDTPIMPPTAEAWQVFGVPCRQEREVESGQLLIDKERCWRALNLCNWYNGHSDFFYQFVYGDKDTFRFAWHRTETPFRMVPWPHEPIPFGLLQFDLEGHRLFQHRIHDKWTLHGNHAADGFWFQQECVDFVAELRASWNPVRHLTRHLNAADRAAMQAFVGRQFYYERVGFTGWPIRFGPDSRVAEGWAANECFWWCEGDCLILAGIDGRVVGRLDRQDDASWKAMTIQRRPTAISLRPINDCHVLTLT